MTGSRHAIVLGIGLFALALAGAAQAQDLSAGKTPAQLFQTNCALCHNSARGLAAAGADKGGFSGLEGFLAEHYTADPKSAAIIAAYLKSVGGAAPTAPTKRHRDAAKPHKPTAKTESAKKMDKKPDNAGAMKSEKSDKPPMAKPGAAASDKMTADKKKPASSSTQAKDEKPVAGDKKTD